MWGEWVQEYIQMCHDPTSSRIRACDPLRRGGKSFLRPSRPSSKATSENYARRAEDNSIDRTLRRLPPHRQRVAVRASQQAQKSRRWLPCGALASPYHNHLLPATLGVAGCLSHQQSALPAAAYLRISRITGKLGTRTHFTGYRCQLNRSMQHSSILLIRLSFSKRPDPLGSTQLNLNRAVFSLNHGSRTNSVIETPADWTSGRCCVDPLRPPR
jgi:hypothetical protein